MKSRLQSEKREEWERECEGGGRGVDRLMIGLSLYLARESGRGGVGERERMGRGERGSQSRWSV